MDTIRMYALIDYITLPVDIDCKQTIIDLYRDLMNYTYKILYHNHLYIWYPQYKPNSDKLNSLRKNLWYTKNLYEGNVCHTLFDLLGLNTIDWSIYIYIMDDFNLIENKNWNSKLFIKNTEDFYKFKQLRKNRLIN